MVQQLLGPRVSPLKSNGLLNSSVIVSSLNSHRNNATVMLHGAALKQTGVLPTARAERSNRRLPGVNSLRFNSCWRNKRLDRPVIVTLPKVSESRERYLKRKEIAALLWAALGFNRDGTRNRFRINRHLARFILIGLYTGTRHDAMLQLQWIANTTGGWFDLDAGVLYRRPQDAIETNKRRTPSPIPPRLMPHLQRWRRLSTQYVIEYDGKPIASQLRRAWTGARAMAGLGADVTPHVLKHTCATLMLQNRVSTWDVAGVLGTSEAVIRKTYGHHSVEHLRTAVDVWSKRQRSKRRVSGAVSGAIKTTDPLS